MYNWSSVCEHFNEIMDNASVTYDVYMIMIMIIILHDCRQLLINGNLRATWSVHCVSFDAPRQKKQQEPCMNV